MSRICVLNPRLQLVEPTCDQQAPASNWEDTTSSEWLEPTSSSSAPESRQPLRCYERSRIVVLGGSPSLSSPFGSSRLH
jgi:hypothetical protein